MPARCVSPSWGSTTRRWAKMAASAKLSPRKSSQACLKRPSKTWPVTFSWLFGSILYEPGIWLVCRVMSGLVLDAGQKSWWKSWDGNSISLPSDAKDGRQQTKGKPTPLPHFRTYIITLALASVPHTHWTSATRRQPKQSRRYEDHVPRICSSPPFYQQPCQCRGYCAF